jgi:hypothetical protein
MTRLEDRIIAREGDSIIHGNTYCILIILYRFENFSLMPRLEDSILARVGDSIIARPSIRIGTPRSNVSNTRPANRTFFYFLFLLLYFLFTPLPSHIPPPTSPLLSPKLQGVYLKKSNVFKYTPCKRVHVRTHTRTRAHTCTHTPTCVCVCLCACLCVCVYIYIYTHR